MEKEKDVIIDKIVSGGTRSSIGVFGLGDDEKIYSWNWNKGRWEKYQSKEV